MRIALELQTCCENRSGVGTYAYELACRLKAADGLEFCGNVFNYRGRNDNSIALQGISFPIRENRILPYGIYRRVWDFVPVSYGTVFPGKTELSIFFNFIVPPRVKGKVITTIHDMTFLRYPETLSENNLRRITSDIQYSVERSDQILAVSEFTKREIVELLHVAPEKITVIYNAPGTLPERGDDFSAVAEKYGLRRPYLLYVGTIEPRKNLVRLIEAFDRLKREENLPHQLVLAGGSGWNNEEIYRAAKDSAFSNEIIFTGYVSTEEKAALYDSADAFVFPSLYEGFGIPPLEAMSRGCPVVCADAASLPEVVGDAAVLADPLDAVSIAEGILRVLRDSALRDTLIERGTRQYQKFTWEKSAQRLTALCREVLERP